ncbi:hypothetical protein [Microscilla marina]|uniref:Transposase n=1 Tax=Microscilla marina ATCC 23134 TaxID=313606 RepID=A1ZRT7_MICM2|nr:hypothetical protein [Microscilla marina]EAY26992.1 transposase [Microscilla marina ATCC 23134]
MGIEEAILQAVREESMEKGMEKGIEQGVEKGILQTALRMKKADFAMADIIKATGLTKAQIEKLV